MPRVHRLEDDLSLLGLTMPASPLGTEQRARDWLAGVKIQARRNYRRLSKAVHPDVVIGEGGTPEAIERASREFQRLTNALERVSGLAIRRRQPPVDAFAVLRAAFTAGAFGTHGWTESTTGGIYRVRTTNI